MIDRSDVANSTALPTDYRRRWWTWLCCIGGAAVAVAADAAISSRMAPDTGLTQELSIGLVSVLIGGSLAAICIRRVRYRGPTGQHPVEKRLTRQREELRALARRIITLQEDERSALSRELHDDIGQDITAIKLSVTALVDEDASQRAATIAAIGGIADQTVIKLRNISLLLRPPQLDALGLESALRWQAGALARPGGPELKLSLDPLPQRPDPAVEVACFRIAQEALTNALRHSGASVVSMALECDGQLLHLNVQDDGRGFDRAHTRGLGLITMRERAQQLGGMLEIDSQPERGTRIWARLPLSGTDGVNQPGAVSRMPARLP